MRAFRYGCERELELDSLADRLIHDPALRARVALGADPAFSQRATRARLTVAAVVERAIEVLDV